MVNMKIALAFLCILALSHAFRRRKYRVKRNVTVEGTLFLNVPNDMPDPDNIIVMIKVGGRKPAESLLPWKLCAKNKKCQYKVRNVAGNVGQKFAVGVHLNYVDNFLGMNIHDDSVYTLEWTSTILEIKGEVTNQDIHYDIAAQRVTPLHPGHDMEKQLTSLRTSISLPIKESSKIKNERGLTVDTVVYGTVEVILPALADGSATAAKPAGVFLKLKLNGNLKRHETNVPWHQCSANRCPYAIEDIRGSVGQTYIVGVTHYYYGDSKRDRRNNVVWSKETAALRETSEAGKIKQDIKYDTVLSSVSLVGLSDVNQSPSNVTSTLAATSSGTSSMATSPVIPPAPLLILPVNPPEHDMGKQIASSETSVPPSSGTSLASLVANEMNKNDKTGLAVDVTVHGTVEIILPVPAYDSVMASKSSGIFIQLKLNDDGNRPGIALRALNLLKRIFVSSGTDYETNVPWNQCIANRCPYTIENVHGCVGQTYTVGVSDYNDESRKKDNVVWSKETAALQTGKNKQDIKYDKVLLSVSLLGLSDVKESITHDAVTPEVTFPSTVVA